MPEQLVAGATGVARALLYLHDCDVCHADVATRNCTVDGGLTVRLGDSALSTDLFPGDYHCLTDGTRKPLKWMALETLHSYHPTRASDVVRYSNT